MTSSSTTSNQVIKILRKVGAIITDSHFVYTSGRHGSVYINKDALYPYTKETALIGKLFAKKYQTKDIDVVVAPAVGGTILSQWTAYYLSKYKNKTIFSTYTEKDKGTTASASESEQLFRRGYDTYIKGKKVIVLEDLTTTGISVKKTINAVRNAGGKVVAVCVMINRDPEKINTKSIGAPFSSLGIFRAESFSEHECPLCKTTIPVNTKVGHGKEFVAKKNQKTK